MNETDWETIAQFVTNALPPEERDAFVRQLDADPSLRRTVDALDRAWEGTRRIELPANGAPSDQARAAWATVSGAMAAEHGVGSNGHSSPARVLTLRRPDPWMVRFRLVARVAAAVALVAGGTTLALRVVRSNHVGASSMAAAQEMRHVTTGRAQRATIELSDGTHIILGAGSRIRYPRTFSGATRDVQLEGEGYFEVAHDTARPFTVHTARATVRDIGTKFGVRAFGLRDAVTVAVSEGSVALRPIARGSIMGDTTRRAADSLVLTVAAIGRINADGRLVAAHQANVAAWLAWTKGQLLFENVPVRDALAQLNHWYGVDVVAGDSTLAGFPLTAALTDEPFPRALAIVAAALDARVVRHGASYTLIRKHHVP